MAKPGRPSPGLDEYLYWQERLENRIASDLSIDDFCEAEGISSSTFYRWARRLKDGVPESLKEEGANVTLAELAEPKFVPISVTASPVGALHLRRRLGSKKALTPMIRIRRHGAALPFAPRVRPLKVGSARRLWCHGSAV